MRTTFTIQKFIFLNWIRPKLKKKLKKKVKVEGLERINELILVDFWNGACSRERRSDQFDKGCSGMTGPDSTLLAAHAGRARRILLPRIRPLALLSHRRSCQVTLRDPPPDMRSCLPLRQGLHLALPRRHFFSFCPGSHHQPGISATPRVRRLLLLGGWHFRHRSLSFA